MPTTDSAPIKKPRKRAAPKAQTNVGRFLRAMKIKANDVELFRTALTHRSAAGERWRDPNDGPSPTSNERLEFYGDAILAPMDGYSDWPFRSICRELGSAMSYTEFIKVEKILSKSKQPAKRMYFTEPERPITGG
mgnify:CR=1 FL=1